MKIKKGVQPPVFYLLAAVANFERHANQNLTITSGIDGNHSEWSGHYQLRAVDIRLHDIPEDQREDLASAIRAEILDLLPADRIYVGIHSKGTPNEHLHIQFK